MFLRIYPLIELLKGFPTHRAKKEKRIICMDNKCNQCIWKPQTNVYIYFNFDPSWPRKVIYYRNRCIRFCIRQHIITYRWWWQVASSLHFIQESSNLCKSIMKSMTKSTWQLSILSSNDIIFWKVWTLTKLLFTITKTSHTFRILKYWIDDKFDDRNFWRDSSSS
jgi:hypothetical protein